MALLGIGLTILYDRYLPIILCFIASIIFSIIVANINSIGGDEA